MGQFDYDPEVCQARVDLDVHFLAAHNDAQIGDVFIDGKDHDEGIEIASWLQT
jgi:hypothetical protein